MANRGYKVANLPLIPEVALPAEVHQVDPRKMVGLTTNPESLTEIRRSRMHSLGLKEETHYTNCERIEAELAYANEWFKKLNIPVIDVSKRSIEESAMLIEEQAKEHWEKAKEALGIDSLSFEILASDTDSTKKAIEYIQSAIQDTLDGVKVSLSPVPFSVRLDRSNSGDFDVVMGGWGADYADASSFTDLFVTDK